MTDALEEQLHTAAAMPSHALDAHALIVRTQRRRRRLLGGVAAAVVVVLATVGIAAVATGGSGGDDAKIAIGVRDDGTPEGWTRVQLAQGTSIAVPAEWDLVPFAFGYASPLGVVGTGAPGVDKDITACGVADTTPTVAGTWVVLYQITAQEPGAPLALPGGEAASESAFRDRPATFGPAAAYNGGSCAMSLAPGADGGVTDATWALYLFRDHGRLFAARVVVNNAGGQTATTELGDRVLDTFRVTGDDPTIATTTTTLPTATTAPVTTTPPPTTVPADASPDELAIRDVYMHLIGQVPRDAIGDYVEDYGSIADSWRAGIAQNSEETQAQYSMQVDSVTMTDANHADVRYSLLFSGRPAYPDQAGGAVKIDGRWYITRETVCALLTHGAITCPARTTPVP